MVGLHRGLTPPARLSRCCRSQPEATAVPRQDCDFELRGETLNMTLNFHSIAFPLLMAPAGALSGCGQEEVVNRPKVFPVTGVVLHDDKPVEGATVMFIPQGHTSAAAALTDANGQFKLQTFEGERRRRSGQLQGHGPQDQDERGQDGIGRRPIAPRRRNVAAAEEVRRARDHRPDCHGQGDRREHRLSSSSRERRPGRSVGRSGGFQRQRLIRRLSRTSDHAQGPRPLQTCGLCRFTPSS